MESRYQDRPGQRMRINWGSIVANSIIQIFRWRDQNCRACSSSPSFDCSPITIGSFRFDHDGDDFTINDPHLGFIVTATHTTNRWTKYYPKSWKTEWNIFGEISLKGEKPKELSYTLVISDSPTDDQEKSTEWRRIGVAVIDHEYLILSESPGIIKVK